MATAQWSANRDPERAVVIWDRLLGCFGDSLLRKFGKTPPAEWAAGINMLNDAQLERGLRRLLFGGKGQPPSLPEFMRLCRAIGNDDFEEGRDELPKLTHDDSYAGDVWDMAANRYLLGHIAKLMKRNSKCFGRSASVKLMQAPEKDLQELGIDKIYLDASGDFVENVKNLVAAKNAWATDMRDIAVKGSVPVADQQTIWRDYMARAGWPA